MTVAAGKFTDAVGNASVLGRLSPSMTLDMNPPTVAVTSSLQTLKAGTTSLITFKLSEASKDFTVADVTVTGGTLSNFAGTAASYTATFTPTAGLVGTGTIAIDAGVFTDAVGNPNRTGSLAGGFTLVA